MQFDMGIYGLGILAGHHGAPRWSPFLARLAERRRVVVPSLPGFPGATGHDRLPTVPGDRAPVLLMKPYDSREIAVALAAAIA